MNQDYKEPPIIISIGGSLLVPNGGIDTHFLSQLNIFIRNYVKKGKRFFLVAGGGTTARHYLDAGKAVIGDMSQEDLDWLGIHATRLNAHLLRTIFEDIAHPRIIENYEKKLHNWKEPIVIGAGWKPGWSTDYDAVYLARDYKANLIINLSNIDWVYDKDPKLHPDARAIEKLTWVELNDLIPKEWKPGINAPFDPVAANLASELKLTVIVANGSDFQNLESIIEGDEFKGTVIMPYRVDASFYDREYFAGKKASYKFTRADSLVSRFFRGIAYFYRALLIKLFLNPANCLDVGCGTGGLVKMMRRFGIDAWGIELSQDALDLAVPSVKPFLRRGEIVDLPYKEDQFELVVTFDVLEHLERSKIKKSVNQTVRVSKKYILHKIYTRENSWISWFHSKDYSHINVLTARFWKKFFLQHEQVVLQRNSFFKLPLFFESVFLLKKK